MRSSKLIGRRYKEKPTEAQIVSHIYLLRGAYVRPVANGIYTLLHPAFRIQQKIEKIIREEMDAIDGQEIKMPVVLPRELWDETGRYDSVKGELLRFQDRNKHGMLLAMTHEEACVAIARSEITSYKDYPFMLYHFQTKFRDEARSRGGLVRVREFVMKDAYSFHRTQEDLNQYYQRCADAYHRIYARCGIPEVVAIEGDNGMMGGKISHEYDLICDAGEDKIAKCSACDYVANEEVASSVQLKYNNEPAKPLQEVHTPNTKTIEDVCNLLGLKPEQTAKMVFYITDSGKMVAVTIRGDIEVNECKLAKVLKETFQFANDAQIEAIGAVPGFASGIGLHDCIQVVDKSVANTANLLCGANKKDHHMYNFNLSRDVPDAIVADIACVQEGEKCPKCGAPLNMVRGIEVGNIFQLGKRYTEAMHLTYTDENGNEQTPIMGCYGIGVGRVLASIIEARHDNYGPIWPLSVSPWQVQLNALQMDKEGITETAEKLYDQLQKAGIEVLYDDRNFGAGPQFAEADLLGIPLRFIVAPKALATGQVEYKVRGTDEKGTIPVDQVVSFAQNWIEQEMKKYK
ncbi:MAG: proline--tRNA ligase [Alphaproteobacteria bacterium]|nr:proline--tRNA ligase [Alphaproteobacteria bacterium]